MGRSRCIRRAKRLLSAASVILVVSFFFSESALAQIGLGSEQNAGLTVGSIVTTLTEAVPTAPVVQQAAPVLHQVAPVVQQTTVPVAATVQPVAATAAPLVSQTVAPVIEVVQPVVAPLVAPIVETAAPILEAATPILESAEPLVSATTAPARETTPLGVDTVVEQGSSGDTIVPAAPVVADDGVTAAAASTARTSSAPAPFEQRHAGRLRGSSPPVVGPATRTWEGTPSPPVAAASRDAAPSAVAVPSQRVPTAPTGPAGFLGAVSAAFAAGAVLVFVAALAAALCLAAPGLGRRLRLRMASWPLPISLPSLERPG